MFSSAFVLTRTFPLAAYVWLRVAKVIEARLKTRSKNQVPQNYIMPISVGVPVDYFCLSRRTILANCVREFSRSGMSGINSKRVTTFVCVMATIAILIHVVQSAREQQKTVVVAQQQREMEREATAQKAVQDAAAEHAAYLAQYVNSSSPRRPGIEAVAIVAASEDGKLNRAITTALVNRFQTEPVEIAHSFFKPAFVSDGLFSDAFAGTGDILNKLELSKSLDALLLARQEVQYSSNPSLENVITATMQLKVVELPMTGDADSKSWTFTVSGAGFKQEEARAMAEERLIKQITTDTNMTFN
jgi:hypothetical protein